MRTSPWDPKENLTSDYARYGIQKYKYHKLYRKGAIIFFFCPFLLVNFKCVVFLRIFQFENFDRTKKRILKTVEDEGALVCY